MDFKVQRQCGRRGICRALARFFEPNISNLKGVFDIPITKVRPYIFNLETTKIELHFDGKEEYDALSDEEKKAVRNAFRYTGRDKCWVSRAKEPNLLRAKRVAESLGFTGEQREGERISYAEQLERKAERADDRADRYESYASNAQRRAVSLQSEMESKRGDNAFFTQPIIPGHRGSQAFARARQRIYDRYHKGFDEYRKSEYFMGRAKTARETANMEHLNDKGYLDRRIKECQKKIRDFQDSIAKGEANLARIHAGEVLKRYDKSVITAEEMDTALDRLLEQMEVAIDKEGFFRNRLEELGGVTYSKDNIKVGYVVDVKRWGRCEVIGTGPKNITYKILSSSAAGFPLKAAYAEINEVISAVEKKKEKDGEKQPFTVGETFSIRQYSNDSSTPGSKQVDFEIIKATDKTIQLREQGTDNPPVTRKPRKRADGKWCFSFDDSYSNTFTKV